MITAEKNNNSVLLGETVQEEAIRLLTEWRTILQRHGIAYLEPDTATSTDISTIKARMIAMMFSPGHQNAAADGNRLQAIWERYKTLAPLLTEPLTQKGGITEKRSGGQNTRSESGGPVLSPEEGYIPEPSGGVIEQITSFVNNNMLAVGIVAIAAIWYFRK